MPHQEQRPHLEARGLRQQVPHGAERQLGVVCPDDVPQEREGRQRLHEGSRARGAAVGAQLLQAGRVGALWEAAGRQAGRQGAGRRHAGARWPQRSSCVSGHWCAVRCAACRPGQLGLAQVEVCEVLELPDSSRQRRRMLRGHPQVAQRQAPQAGRRGQHANVRRLEVPAILDVKLLRAGMALSGHVQVPSTRHLQRRGQQLGRPQQQYRAPGCQVPTCRFARYGPAARPPKLGPTRSLVRLVRPRNACTVLQHTLLSSQAGVPGPGQAPRLAARRCPTHTCGICRTK